MAFPGSVTVLRSSPAPSERSASYLRIHAINIYVRDQDRSLRFYLDQLGFQLAFDARLQSGERWVAVSPPDGSAVLTLIAPQPDSEEFKLIGRPTEIVFVTEDAMAKYLEWSARGVLFRFVPRLRRMQYEFANPTAEHAAMNEDKPIWGGVFTRFEDLDKNSFALISIDEVTRAVEEQRRAAEARLEAERRAAQELEIAASFQSRLFPQAQPTLKTLDYAGACLQARSVGGDYYDFLDLGQERVGFVVADVAGKGMAAALLMANLQANVRSQCAVALEQPERLLRSVNHLFYANTVESVYATLFFADYNDSTRRLRYANCGHLPALILRTDGFVYKACSTSTVVGLFPIWDCVIGECQLCPGDSFALYTDGITESCNEHGEEFGEARLIEALSRHGKLPPKERMNAVIDEVTRFCPREQQDDITLILGTCKAD
jgi:serine phosphatase RsbU (regulator of sigma subunit)